MRGLFPAYIHIYCTEIVVTIAFDFYSQHHNTQQRSLLQSQDVWLMQEQCAPFWSHAHSLLISPARCTPAGCPISHQAVVFNRPFSPIFNEYQFLFVHCQKKCLYLSCHLQKTNCLYYLHFSFYNFLKYNNLRFSIKVNTLLPHTVKNIKM